MRRTTTAVLSAGVLAFPALASAHAATAPAAKKKIVTVKKTYKGSTAEADRWGTVTITVTVRTTTVTRGTKKTVTKKYVDLGGNYSYHTDRSQFIMSQALPILRQEFLTAQTATGVQLVTNATYTSQAFMQSLQSALLQAK